MKQGWNKRVWPPLWLRPSLAARSPPSRRRKILAGRRLRWRMKRESGGSMFVAYIGPGPGILLDPRGPWLYVLCAMGLVVLGLVVLAVQKGRDREE
jgi:hypothetical protein